MEAVELSAGPQVPVVWSDLNASGDMALCTIDPWAVNQTGCPDRAPDGNLNRRTTTGKPNAYIVLYSDRLEASGREQESAHSWGLPERHTRAARRASR